MLTGIEKAVGEARARVLPFESQERSGSSLFNPELFLKTPKMTQKSHLFPSQTRLFLLYGTGKDCFVHLKADTESGFEA